MSVGKIHSFAADDVRSLVWQGDDLVDWARGGTRWRLDGTHVDGRFGQQFPFDAAVATPDGVWAVAYARFGTKAALMHEGVIVRELNRSMYHSGSYVYPICLWQHHDGRVLLAHCPEDYDRLEIEDAQTGERLCTGTRAPEDFFHGRLAVSPDRRKLSSAGWVRHPWDWVGVFDLERVLADPGALDRFPPPWNELQVSNVAERSSACWLDARRLLIGASAEFDDEPDDEDMGGVRLEPLGVATVDASRNVVLGHVQLDRPSGRMMPVGLDHVLCLYDIPRLISLQTGKVVDAWPQLRTGREMGSIIAEPDRAPPMALDRERRRLAVFNDGRIHVLQIDLDAAHADPPAPPERTAIGSIRTRPGLYVGDTGANGLHHLLFWLLRDGAASPGGRARTVRVMLGWDGAVSLQDDRHHAAPTCAWLRNALEQLGSASDPDFVVANALSARFEISAWRDGEGATAVYEQGWPVRGPHALNQGVGSGTRIELRPDPDIFGAGALDPERVAERLEEMAGLHPGLENTLIAVGTTRRWCWTHGLRAWIRTWAPIPGDEDKVLHGEAKSGAMRCEVAWRWTASGRTLRGWVNGVQTCGGGTHADALRSLLAARANGRGWVAAVHVEMPHPRFEAPIKDTLRAPEVAALVRSACELALSWGGDQP